MRITIRSKLMLAISILMIVIFAAAAYLFISEKRVELADDIYDGALAYTELTMHHIVDDFELYHQEGGFVFFNREMSKLFDQNADIAAMSVVTFDGDLLYDSELDAGKQYQGDPRMLGGDLLGQVQARNISFKTVDGAIYYLKEIDGEKLFVDENEVMVTGPEAGTMVEYFVGPADEKYSVVYTLTYENLEARVAIMMERIIYLAIFAIMLGMMLSFGLSSQVTRPVGKLVEGAGRIAKGDFKARVDVHTHDEMKFLGDAFNQMAVDLEKSVEARVYQERVGKELEIASDIQKRIVPKDVPQVDGLDLAASLIPATEIGGDMYDFLKLQDGRLLMYLGDVTGHGVPAGIVSSISNALFYAYSAEPDLKRLILNVNRVLTAKTMPTMFMTLCLMSWNPADRKFQFVNAGHEQLLCYKAATGEVEMIDVKGMALGMVADLSEKVQVSDVDLAAGDVLLVYSDGIVEAWKNEHEKYGFDKLKAVLKKSSSGSAEEIKNVIVEDVKNFTADYEQKDDMTLIVAKKVE